ncbi:hypothetical protein F5880DRAFT_1626226 [Lentinula raphanica]|nr:hypothetical protein F5880DRAFT_1626226 [Lentinula raphanica]
MVPKAIYQTKLDAKLVNRIRGMRCFRRLAGHASAAFATWAPKLHAMYHDYSLQLQKLIPDLKHNFPNSVFSCCTLNFGPRTTTVEHLDHKNYIFVVELPPGWTILLPSAYLRHSNTTIHEGESRFSFTQYTAGGLFRVIDDEGISRSRMSPAERRHAQRLQRQRLNTDLNCYSTLQELGVDANNVQVSMA